MILDIREDVSDTISVVPANEASWRDLRAIFGMRGYTARCQCQRFKVGNPGFTPVPVDERAFRLCLQTDCGHPEPGATSGLVAYLDGEPVGWCAVEPRSAYPFLPPARLASKERGDGEVHVGSRSVFAAAGFHEVSKPTLRRVMMRIDFR